MGDNNNNHDDFARWMSLTTSKDSNTLTYKKLNPQTDGTCVEISGQFDEENTNNNVLFNFIPDKGFHIFCICFEGLNSRSEKINHHLFNNLWKQAISDRQKKYLAEKHQYSDQLVFCKDFNAFADCLFMYMWRAGCININKRDEFIAFLNHPYDKDKCEFFYKDIDDTDIAFLYVISDEVYQTLMTRYNLPLHSSSVVKMPLYERKLRESSDKQNSLEIEDKEYIYHMFKKLNSQSQTEVVTSLRSLLEYNKSHNLYKTNEAIEDNSLKVATKEDLGRSD